MSKKLILGKIKKGKVTQPLVDVLLATYCSNLHFLKIQIQSILNQSYTNLHLIISDDAPKIDTESQSQEREELIKLLKQYEQEDKRVTVYFQQENLGYLKNFEFLLNQSTAEYISFADHDDIWYKDKIKKSLQTLQEKKVDLVYTDAEQIDENGLLLQKSYIRYKNMPQLKANEKRKNILAFSRHIAIGCSQLFTKTIKEQMLPFSEDMMAHDWISVYLASKQKGVIFLDEPLFGYRLHGNNEFGGRSLKQNIGRWKQQQGKSPKAYHAYRQNAVTHAYAEGARMCETYRKRLGLPQTREEKEVLAYYQKIEKTNLLNIHLIDYNRYLAFPEMGNRKAKEIMLFHFPILSYFIYLLR